MNISPSQKKTILFALYLAAEHEDSARDAYTPSIGAEQFSKEAIAEEVGGQMTGWLGSRVTGLHTSLPPTRANASSSSSAVTVAGYGTQSGPRTCLRRRCRGCLMIPSGLTPCRDR